MQSLVDLYISKSTPYFTDKVAKARIDDCLHRNACIFQNMGSRSTKKERALAKKLEKQNLREVMHYDPELIKAVMRSGD